MSAGKELERAGRVALGLFGRFGTFGPRELVAVGYPFVFERRQGVQGEST